MAVQEKISLTEPNDKWLTEQVENNGYANKDEAVNHLIRKIREEQYIDAEIEAAEESVRKHGWVEKTPEEILAGFKEKARRNGKL